MAYASAQVRAASDGYTRASGSSRCVERQPPYAGRLLVHDQPIARVVYFHEGIDCFDRAPSRRPAAKPLRPEPRAALAALEDHSPAARGEARNRVVASETFRVEPLAMPESRSPAATGEAHDLAASGAFLPESPAVLEKVHEVWER
jgi:hypothetical protein